MALGVWAAAGGCGSGTASSNDNPCLTYCNKHNSCLGSSSTPVPCAAICAYGGNFSPGLGPAPACTNLAAQASCVASAVTLSCDTYQAAIAKCPACPVLDGSACSSDGDCQKYRPDYSCDLSRPGGYCTRACQSADDCSAGGPEICAAGRAPSFDPQAPTTQSWCLLGCGSDANCRTGYSCMNFSATLGFGTCDAP